MMCESLKTVSFPNDLKVVKDVAFDLCGSLEKVDVQNSNTALGQAVFAECSSLKEISAAESNELYQVIDGNLYSKDKTELIQYAIGKPDEVFVVPNSTTSIRENAFAWSENLIHITIPESVNQIDGGAFNNCNSLKIITYEGTSEQWENAVDETFWENPTYYFTVRCADGVLCDLSTMGLHRNDDPQIEIWTDPSFFD